MHVIHLVKMHENVMLIFCRSLTARKTPRRPWKTLTIAGSVPVPFMRSYRQSPISVRLAADSMKWGVCVPLTLLLFSIPFVLRVCDSVSAWNCRNRENATTDPGRAPSCSVFLFYFSLGPLDSNKMHL